MSQEEDGPSWLNKGPIGPPIAHVAAGIGAVCCAALGYLLHSRGFLSGNLTLVLVAAGYCIPFAIAREMVARRIRNFLAKEQTLSNDEH